MFGVTSRCRPHLFCCAKRPSVITWNPFTAAWATTANTTGRRNVAAAQICAVDPRAPSGPRLLPGTGYATYTLCSGVAACGSSDLCRHCCAARGGQPTWLDGELQSALTMDTRKGSRAERDPSSHDTDGRPKFDGADRFGITLNREMP